MSTSLRRVSCVLALLVLVSSAAPSFAVDLRCVTVCTPTCPCDQLCTESGFWTTCGDEGYTCVSFRATSGLLPEPEPIMTPAPEESLVQSQPALDPVAEPESKAVR